MNVGILIFFKYKCLTCVIRVHINIIIFKRNIILSNFFRGIGGGGGGGVGVGGGGGVGIELFDIIFFTWAHPYLYANTTHNIHVHVI